jgi:LPXTG-motif cell wall-anchored protein
MMGVMPTRDPEAKRPRGATKIFLMLLGVAGLGVGVWLFRRRRSRSDR